VTARRSTTSTGGEVIAPTLEDPVVASASEIIGGPTGRRSVGAPWWRPVRVVLAMACLFWALAMVQKLPCSATDWEDGELRARVMCYSDIPYLYAGRGFAERVVPFSDTEGRYMYLEYPVVTGYFTYAAALVTHAVNGFPDLEPRARVSTETLGGWPPVRDERQDYFLVTAVLLAPFALLAAYFLAGAHRRRPWDAIGYAAAPVVITAGLINWDVLAVCCVAGAFWAWARGRPVVSGLLIGVGTATKLYPLFLLGALLVVCLRRRQLPDLARAVAAAVAAWLACNVPVIVLNLEGWRSFWTFNSERGPDLGSLWLIASHHGWEASAHTINVTSWVFFGGACLLVLVLGLRAHSVPRIAQLSFLIVMSFLLVNKVYSPQYVLWLLPIAALAVPRWRHLLIWQSTELLYFAVVWWHLAGLTASATDGAPDPVYTVAVVLRVFGQLYLGTVIVRDVLRPRHDVVREFPDDDPMCPPRMLATSTR
jgi:uncharacterized membrane protein